MSKVSLFVISLFGLILLINCKESPNSGVENNAEVPLAKVEIISSEILREDREVWVYTPPEFYGMDTTDVRFPVIYMVDADGHFLPLVGIAD